MQYVNTIRSLNFEFTVNTDSTVTVKAKTDAAKFLFRVKKLGRKASNAASGNEVFDLIAQYEQKLVILAGV